MPAGAGFPPASPLPLDPATAVTNALGAVAAYRYDADGNGCDHRLAERALCRRLETAEHDLINISKT